MGTISAKEAISVLSTTDGIEPAIRDFSEFFDTIMNSSELEYKTLEVVTDPTAARPWVRTLKTLPLVETDAGLITIRQSIRRRSSLSIRLWTNIALFEAQPRDEQGIFHEGTPLAGKVTDRLWAIGGEIHDLERLEGFIALTNIMLAGCGLETYQSSNDRSIPSRELPAG